MMIGLWPPAMGHLASSHNLNGMGDRQLVLDFMGAQYLGNPRDIGHSENRCNQNQECI